MPTTTFQFLHPRLLRVHYQAPDELDPAGQGPLLEAMRTAAAQHGPAGVVFVVEKAVVSVSPEVPAFWLKATDDPGLGLLAMAVVSPSLAVRMAASAFGISSVLRRHALRVKAFTDEQAAIAWCNEQLA